MPELCKAWRDLIFNQKNIGQIYQRFSIDRIRLIDHLQRCERCQNLIRPIQPMPAVLMHLQNFSPQEFAVIIREVRVNANRGGGSQGQP